MSPAVEPSAGRTPAHVALLTPPGRGAVATVLVTGPNAIEVVGEKFRPASGRQLANFACDQIIFGRWESQTGEEIVVALRAADRLEIHCHGGTAAPRAIIASLCAMGCEEIDWRQATRAAHDDPFTAEAAILLPRALTERGAAILLDQQRGALRWAWDKLDSLFSFATSAAGELEVEFRDMALVLLQALLARAAVGLHLAEPWRVVFAGPPNVGKSSLINSLVGYERVIVHPTPGTTRDSVATITALAGWPVELSDTAGIRTTSDPLEAAGIERTHERTGGADLVVLVFDATAAWSSTDAALVAAWPQAVVLYNKCDLMCDSTVAIEVARPQGLQTSAITRQGLEQLVSLLVQRLVPAPPQSGDAVPFTTDQHSRLKRAAEAIARQDWIAAREQLLLRG